MEKGLIHIYCGDGKGKTSAAIGLAVRAAGNGMKVLFTRFLKILDQISGIEMIHLKKSFGFYKTLSEQGKKEMSEMYFRLWKEILVKARKEEYDVLVMDEFMAAYNYGLIPNEDAITFLKEKPERMEIVLTGRNPDERLIELADYVSEIKKRKHPFDRGIYARKGIEY